MCLKVDTSYNFNGFSITRPKPHFFLFFFIFYTKVLVMTVCFTKHIVIYNRKHDLHIFKTRNVILNIVFSYKS